MKLFHKWKQAELSEVIAHDGTGQVLSARVAEAGTHRSMNFIDMTEIPPGCSIGVHTHETDNEEVYVVISGSGSMSVEDRSVAVEPGDVVVNPPGGTHGLMNPGPGVLRIVVIEVPVTD